MSFFLLLMIGQLIGVLIVSAVLRIVLNRMLMDLAIRHIEAWRMCEAGRVKTIAVVSYKPLTTVYGDRLKKAVARNFPSELQIEFRVEKSLWGGAVVYVDGQKFDCSLRDRLQQALRMR